MLKPEVQAEILALYFGGKKSVRRIAIELGINRDSVRSVIKRRTVNLVPAKANRSSILDPFKEQIKEWLTKTPDMRVMAIFNQIRDQGYMGGSSTVHEWVRIQKAAKSRPKEAFLRLEFQPGECAQVDWGEFGDVFGDGIKIHCFVIVLCYSRLLYLEFTRSEKFEDFIRCHEHAFKFFGGVPKECWYDNLGSAVTERMGSLVRFNARFMAYMGHHHIRPHACNLARGNEKGRVEDAIKFIRMNFWSGRAFKDFEDLTSQAIVWRNNFANQRTHRSTRRIPRLHFESQEKVVLGPLNSHLYDTDEVVSKTVPPDFHIVYETNHYSVPWTLVGITVTLRVNAQNIKIYYNERFVTAHVRSYRKHQVLTEEKHRTGLLDRKPGAKKEGWQLAAIKNIGPKMREYVDLLRSGQRSLRIELSRILALATVYGEDAVHKACEELLSDSIVGVENLELILKARHHPAASKLNPEPLNFQNQKLNRIVPVVDLRRFDALLLESKQSRASEEEEEKNGNEQQELFGDDPKGAGSDSGDSQ